MAYSKLEQMFLDADQAGDTESAGLFYRELQRQRQAAASQPSPPPSDPAPLSFGERLAVSPLMVPLFMAKGAADTGIGLAQKLSRLNLVAPTGAPVIGGDGGLAEQVASGDRGASAVDQLQSSINQGWDALKMRTGADRGYAAPVAEFIGGAVGPMKAAGAVTKALPWLTDGGLAARTVKAIPFGALQGGVGATFAPQTQPSEDFWGEEAKRAKYAMAAGAMLGPIPGLVQGASGFGQKVRGLFTPEGRQEMHVEAIKERVGGKTAEIVRALQEGLKRPRTPGVQPTVGELLADTPGATGLISQERYLASRPSVSGLFAERTAAQQRAAADALQPFSRSSGMLEGDKAVRDTVTGRMRESALDAANAPAQAASALADEVAAASRVAKALAQQEQTLEKTARAGWRESVSAEKRLRKLIPPVTNAPQQSGQLQSQVEKFGVPPTPLRSSVELSEAARLGEKAQQGAVTAHTAADLLPAAQRAAEDAAFQAGELRVRLDDILPLTAKPVLRAVAQQLNSDNVKGSASTQSVLRAIQQTLSGMADKNGSVNARALDTLRSTGIKDILLKEYEGKANTGAVTKHAVASVRQAIDDAIEAAGGVGYKEYLKRYGKMSEEIDRYAAGNTLQGILAPQQATSPSTTASKFSQALDEIAERGDLTGKDMAVAERVKEELLARTRMAALGKKTAEGAIESGASELELPHFLSSKIALTNFYIRHAGKNAQQKLAEEAALLHLNPEEYIKLLTGAIRVRRDVPTRILAEGLDPLMGVMAEAGPAVAGQYAAKRY